jgi:hypothetical protein
MYSLGEEESPLFPSRAQPDTTFERITLGEAKDRIARYEWITIRNV